MHGTYRVAGPPSYQQRYGDPMLDHESLALNFKVCYGSKSKHMPCTTVGRCKVSVVHRNNSKLQNLESICQPLIPKPQSLNSVS